MGRVYPSPSRVMIRFPCPKCGKTLKAPLGTEGRQSKCKCGNAVQVPYPMPPTLPPEQPAQLIPMPRSAFAFRDNNSPIERPRRRRSERDDDGDGRPTVIEKTSKFWKAHMLIGAGAAILGTLLFCVGLGDPHANGAGATPLAVPGLMLLLLGLFWFIIARIGAWWHHG